MKTKLFEVRDTGTFIPVLAVQFGSDIDVERWLLARAGYGPECRDQCRYVWLSKIASSEPGNSTYDPHGWPSSSRTMQVAHQHITEHFDDLETGAVIDVEFILRLQTTIKDSERLEEFKDYSQATLIFPALGKSGNKEDQS